MKIKYFIALLLFPFVLNAQGGLMIESGAKVVVSNSPQIVVNDGRFKNDGDFTAGNSTVIMTGDASTPNTTIGGAAVTIFNDLDINKNSNDVRLDYDIQVDGNLEMNGGLLILNYSDIVLGGDIINETESNRVTGTDGGAIIKTINLNMPTGENPGNLGAKITSTANLGTTTIRRSHVQMENNGNHSIYRHYSIGTEHSNLNAILRLYYFDAELAGLAEENLQNWQYDEVEWLSNGSESSNTSENWVETSGIVDFHTHTLAIDMEAVLPVELLYFDAVVNEKREVDLNWVTVSESNNDYFTVERSKNGIDFEQLEEIEGAGNTLQSRNYHTVDPWPYAGVSYYRLRQTDFDGTYSFSAIKAVEIKSTGQYTVYPNPLKEVLHIVGATTSKGKTIIQISDALGHVVYYKCIELGERVNSIDISEVEKFEAGNYFLVIQTRDETFTFNLVKVRE